MTTTVTTFERELIVKAARRYVEDMRDTRYKNLVANTRLETFGEVAADVLRFTMTPFAFKVAIKEALDEYPVPYMATSRVAAAELARSEWADKFVAAVMAKVAS